MDGTTLNDQVQIPEENYEAMRAAVQAGHEVVITTGRPLASAKILLKKWKLDEIGLRYVIAFNGGMILDAVTGEILYQKTCPLDQMKLVIEEAKKLGIYIQTYEGELVLTEREGACLDHYINRNRMQVKVVLDLLTSLQEEACKLLAIDLEHPERLIELKKNLDLCTKNKMECCFSSVDYLEILPCGVSKGEALLAFCEMQGIPVKHTLAAGDENNDISMLRTAGIGCAVANARPNVKEMADYITDCDNNHGAVREIIEKFMLPV